jgi:hypothetical protein
MTELEQFVTTLGPQWDEPGDDKAKRKLAKQLGKSFPEDAYDWLLDPRVKVSRPDRVDPESVEYDDYPEWRASRQLKEVRKTAKKIVKGKEKPAVVAELPNGQREVLDGHHHWLAAIDAKTDPLAYVVRVPRYSGPWDAMQDKQQGDPRKDDFGKTSSYDRND